MRARFCVRVLVSFNNNSTGLINYVVAKPSLSSLRHQKMFVFLPKGFEPPKLQEQQGLLRLHELC